jgi:hypothetical protein
MRSEDSGEFEPKKVEIRRDLAVRLFQHASLMALTLQNQKFYGPDSCQMICRFNEVEKPQIHANNCKQATMWNDIANELQLLLEKTAK